jgi:hypothetical protein
MTAEIEDFRREIEPLLETYRSIDVRVVADRLPDGRWRVLRLRALLSPEEEMDAVADSPALPELFVAQLRWPASALDKLLQGFETGELTIKDTTVYAQQDAGNNTWRPLNSYARAYERTAAQGEFQLDWRLIVLRGYGTISNTGQWYRKRDRINAALRTADPPWDGLAEVYRGFVGEPTPTGELNDTQAWIIAPLPVRFKEVRLGPELSTEVECFKTINPSQAALAVLFTMEGRNVKRLRVALSKALPTHDKSYKLAIPIPEAFSGIICALTYGGLDADRQDLFRAGQGGAPRSWSILLPTIGTPEEFSDRIQDLNGDPLEHGIAVLFHLLGFSVVHIGKNAFNTDSPDILAFSPVEDWMCVIEATAGGSGREPDLPAKIEKLSARTREIVQSSGGLRVMPVLVIPRSPGLVTEGARQRAATEGVSLITADKLRQLVMLSTGAPPARLVIDFLSNSIPSRYS